MCPACEQPTVGVNIGGTMPLAMRSATGRGITFERPDAFQWMPTLDGIAAREEMEIFKMLNAPAADEPGIMDFVLHTAMNAVLSAQRVRNAMGKYKGGIDYPNNRFASSLRIIAQMIAGGLPTKVYYANMTGFDTHASQRGAHDVLLEQFASGVEAFLRDLDAQGNADRVLVMAFSEFGRRVAENGSAGTDHGTAAPMLVFGRRIKPGLHGRHPSLSDLQDGDLKHHVDFRSVYATVLEGWLGADAAGILGSGFERVPFLS
jgi:uncharacterized protein (DUF1501 family)